MMFQVDYSSQALKFLKKTDKVLAARILKKIEELKEIRYCMIQKPFMATMKIFSEYGWETTASYTRLILNRINLALLKLITGRKFTRFKQSRSQTEKVTVLRPIGNIKG